MNFLRNPEHNTPANKTTNGEYLMNHLRATYMKVANTYYQKPNKLKGTYQKKIIWMEDHHGTQTDTAN